MLLGSSVTLLLKTAWIQFSVGVLPKTPWLEFHIQIHHTWSLSTDKQCITPSLSRPRKPSITSSSCLRCRPLIVLNENRCGCLQRSPAREGLQQNLCHKALTAMLDYWHVRHRQEAVWISSLHPTHSLQHSNISPRPQPIAKKTYLAFHHRKVQLRAWVDTFMPQGPDEIKTSAMPFMWAKK